MIRSAFRTAVAIHICSSAETNRLFNAPRRVTKSARYRVFKQSVRHFNIDQSKNDILRSVVAGCQLKVVGTRNYLIPLRKVLKNPALQIFSVFPLPLRCSTLRTIFIYVCISIYTYLIYVTTIFLLLILKSKG